MKKMNEIKENNLEHRFISEFIKTRNSSGITQAQMAEKAGTIREVVSAIESGKKHPRIDTLIKLLEPFGYTLSVIKVEDELNNI